MPLIKIINSIEACEFSSEAEENYTLVPTIKNTIIHREVHSHNNKSNLKSLENVVKIDKGFVVAVY